MSSSNTKPEDTLPTIPSAIQYGNLERRMGYFLRRAQISVFADFYRTFEGQDLRPVQYSVLTIIEHNPGRPQTQISDALGIKKANFVPIIVALEKRGLVRRTMQKNDRRSYGLYLTEAGAALMPHLHQLADEHEQRIAQKIGAEAYAALFGQMKALDTL